MGKWSSELQGKNKEDAERGILTLLRDRGHSGTYCILVYKLAENKEGGDKKIEMECTLNRRNFMDIILKGEEEFKLAQEVLESITKRKEVENVGRHSSNLIYLWFIMFKKK